MADPDQLSRSDDPEYRAAATAFLSRCLPGVSHHVLRHDTCMYTMSPDGHFIVDKHPAHQHVCFAAGLSGHGFKFAPVLGELLAQRALGEAAAVSAGFLELERFSR